MPDSCLMIRSCSLTSSANRKEPCMQERRGEANHLRKKTHKKGKQMDKAIQRQKGKYVRQENKRRQTFNDRRQTRYATPKGTRREKRWEEKSRSQGVHIIQHQRRYEERWEARQIAGMQTRPSNTKADKMENILRETKWQTYHPKRRQKRFQRKA